MTAPPRILVAAYTALPFQDRRQLCWDTWFSYFDRFYRGQIQPLFIYGSDPPVTDTSHQYYWTLPSKPDYPSLPWRTYQLLEVALFMASWDYIFKCDDDTYIHPDRFAAFDPRPHEFLGAEWSRMGYYSGGEGYFVSREAAQRVLPHLRRHLTEWRTDAEDLMMGRAMQDAGYPRPDSGIFFRKHHAHDIWPNPNNQYICCHMKHTTRGHLVNRWEQVMRGIHDQFYPTYTPHPPLEPLAPI